MKKAILAKTISGGDGFGNHIKCKKPDFRVVLKLAHHAIRNIGKIVTHCHCVYFIIKRDKKKHLLRKANSWGLNDHVIQNLPDDGIIVLNEKGGSQSFLSVADVKEYGKYLFFKQQGFERQIFVELKHWKKEDDERII